MLVKCTIFYWLGTRSTEWLNGEGGREREREMMLSRRHIEWVTSSMIYHCWLLCTLAAMRMQLALQTHAPRIRESHLFGCSVDQKSVSPCAVNHYARAFSLSLYLLLREHQFRVICVLVHVLARLFTLSQGNWLESVSLSVCYICVEHID